MRITIQAIDQEAMAAGAPRANGKARNGNPAARARPKFLHSMPLSATAEAPTKPAKDRESEESAAEVSTPVNNSSSALASAILPAETQNPALSDSDGDGKSAYGSGAGAAGGGGIDSEFTGAGSGPGNGAGSSGGAINLFQARYRDTPRPVYPESARRDGHEGQVLLRVLVDDQGRSKHVEINSSSGSDILDRAAAEAIRLWRFHPARYGDQPVESWLRIPIEFRLADAKSR